MNLANASGLVRSRRWFVSFLGSLPHLLAATPKGHVVASALIRYADGSTEFPVTRLTDPKFTSRLPCRVARSISHKSNFLVYCSDIGGRFDVYRLDLKSGASKQLTEATALEPEAVTLSADERNLFCMDSGRLQIISLSSLRVRDICKVSDGYQAVSGISVAEDGLYAAFIERKGASHRLQLVRVVDGVITTLAEAEEEFRDPLIRPKRASVLYRRAGGVWLANYDGKQNYKLRLADGEAGPASWSRDGRDVIYLNFPAPPRKLYSLREFTPDTNEDRLIADTTQFVGFGANADSSVFVGASGSKASPYVLLLVRAVKRELTLCEHRASDPLMVNPVFSAKSQQVFFTSDQHGKPAIYSMAVERLVTETDEP